MNDIFFYANIRTKDFTLGITRKVFLEIEAFRKQGFIVTYSGYLPDGVAIFDNNNNVILKKEYPIKNEVLSHLIRRTLLMNLCIEFLKRHGIRYKFSYVRYHFFDKTYVRLLAALKTVSDKVIIEAHSTPKFEKGLNPMAYIGWKDARWNKYAKRYVDLVASMSDEDNLWGIETVKISNGIDINSIKIHEYKGEQLELNLIAVSFEGAVHGYDRVLKGIYNYYQSGGNRTIKFHIVGTTMKSTDFLIEKLDLQKCCIKYGPKAGKTLEEIYDIANMGVGCLANHRIGSFYGSALKTKEYIAKGIPFIYGWKEKVLENFEYAKCYELNEEPIDMNSVIRFYDSLDKKNLPQKIRSCLGVEDTWEFQMRKVIDTITNM